MPDTDPAQENQDVTVQEIVLDQLKARAHAGDLAALAKILALPPAMPRHWACDSLLESAAEHGHLEVARQLIDEGSYPRSNENKVIKLAVKAGHNEILALLVRPGTHKLHKRYSAIAIEYAVSIGQASVVAFLIDAVDQQKIWGLAGIGPESITMAVRRGHTDVIKLLLKARPLFDWPDALRTAAMEGQSQMVGLLLAEMPPRPDYNDVIFAAASRGQAGIIRQLLDASNQQTVDVRALAHAATLGYDDVVALILPITPDPEQVLIQKGQQLARSSFNLIRAWLDARTLAKEEAAATIRPPGTHRL